MQTSKKSFYEQTVDSLPIDLQDVENNKGKVYVEQLHKIGCDEEEVIEAIHDFIRAASERSRLAEDGEISKQKFELYYDDLLNYWKSISKPKFRFAQKGAFAQVGYEVYYTCIAYKGKINNYEPEQGYTHKGTYHYLSDQIKLGWHPEWESIKRKRKMINEFEIFQNKAIGAHIIWEFSKNYQMHHREKASPSLVEVMPVLPLCLNKRVVSGIKERNFKGGAY
ncbi:ABC-three component system protein [Mucilaginibacter antarcticus]|uniref:ABC-three component system protein n=1 Tax=Mucilaginibacter antarcticus TaxID=1855725 RepID=UPI00363DB0ED